jgi:hypothetical protein
MSLKKRIARWITPREAYETRVVWQNPDGSLSATHIFREPGDARRYARFIALRRNPLGRRAIKWLADPRAGEMSPPDTVENRGGGADGS